MNKHTHVSPVTPCDESRLSAATARLNIRIAPHRGGRIPGGTEPEFIRPFPRLFIAIADAFCGRLNDGGDDAQKEVFRFDMQVFSLCVAGGLDQHNWYEMADGRNYIYKSLGADIDLSDPPGCIQPKPEKLTKTEGPGLVYILSNPSLPGLLKIGYTCLTVAERVRQLSSSTSIPQPFAVVASFETTAPITHEAQIHALLAPYRTPGREFFSIGEVDAVAACKAVIGGVA